MRHTIPFTVKTTVKILVTEKRECVITTCKKLVWSTLIGRIMSIWILCLIPESDCTEPRVTTLPLEVMRCGVGKPVLDRVPRWPYVVLYTLYLIIYLSSTFWHSFFHINSLPRNLLRMRSDCSENTNWKFLVPENVNNDYRIFVRVDK